MGEPVVAVLEQAAEIFKIFLSEGVAGIWRFIQDHLADLKSTVLDAIFDFVKNRVIIAGITWIIGLLNPASAFFKACKAIYDIVEFFINRGSQILALVNAIVDSVASVAKGAVSAAMGSTINGINISSWKIVYSAPLSNQVETILVNRGIRGNFVRGSMANLF